MCSDLKRYHGVLAIQTDEDAVLVIDFEKATEIVHVDVERGGLSQFLTPTCLLRGTALAKDTAILRLQQDICSYYIYTPRLSVCTYPCIVRLGNAPVNRGYEGLVWGTPLYSTPDTTARHSYHHFAVAPLYHICI